jgi:flavodoxin
METVKLYNQTVCYDSYNFESKTELQSFLKSEEIKSILENIKEDVIMVLG